MLVVGEVAAMVAERGMFLVGAVQRMRRVCMILRLEAFVQVELGLVGLMARGTVQQSMILPVVGVIEHAVSAVCWGASAGRTVGRWRISSRLKEAPAIGDWRAVSMVESSGVGGMLILIEILAAGIEPGETIGHHRSKDARRDQTSQGRVVGALNGSAESIRFSGRRV